MVTPATPSSGTAPLAKPPAAAPVAAAAPATTPTAPATTATTPATAATTPATPAASVPPASKPLPADRRSFKLWGDPHAVAGDGKKFDNEQVGTMTQLKSASGDFELQTTQDHPPGKPKVTVNTSAAIKVGRDVVSYDVTRNALVVNSKAVTLKPGETMKLADAGTVSRDAKGNLSITSAKGDVINLKVAHWKEGGAPYLNLDGHLGASRMDGEVRGAMGNFHAGDAANADFVGRDGKTYDAQYGHGDYKSMVSGNTYNKANVEAFQKSWLVPTGGGLLIDNQGQGTQTAKWTQDALQTAKADSARQKSQLALGGEPWKPGAGQLQGADTSNWQSLADFNASIAGSQFSVIKASQGTGYVDPSFKARWDLLGKKVDDGSMKLRMAYGFLDPGDGKAQAQHFLDTVGVKGKLAAGTRLVLDWEGPALNSPNTLHDAANHIHDVTGTWPVVYVQGSKMDVAKSTVPNAPIWEAAYGSGINKDVPFFQYSDGPKFDHDVFNGDVNALKKFAGWA